MSNIVGHRREELEDLETIKFVASALFDVSAEKIGRLRAEFEKNKAFYDDIAGLYQSIKQTAFDRGELPQRSVKVVRTVSVAFTSNTRFYGAVNAGVINTFVEHMKSGAESDYVVIGRTGKAMMENEPAFAQRSSYYSFTDDEPTGEETRQFLKNIAPYDQVQVFYPSFVNVFVQNVALHDITYAPHSGDTSSSEEFDYIFEPELPKILAFFETRVRYLLFERAMLESELARTAARLFSMNQAQDHSDKAVVTLRRAIRRDEANFNDSRLLESFSAISRWKK